ISEIIKTILTIWVWYQVLNVVSRRPVYYNVCYDTSMTHRKFSIGRVILFFAAVLAILGAVYWYTDRTITTVNIDKKENEPAEVPISITRESIKEENFSGLVARVSGSGVLATEAQKYIDQTVSDFKIQA